LQGITEISFCVRELFCEQWYRY